MNTRDKEHPLQTMIETDGMTPELEERILAERARSLAAPETSPENEGKEIHLLEFLLNGERYAVAMQYVREVSLLRSLAVLPGTPDFILGIVSMRGRVIAVTDLRVFFHLPRKGLSDYNKIIVLSDNSMEFAILAEQVNGVKTCNLSQIASPPLSVQGIGREFLSGVFPDALILIDAGAVLSDPRMIVRKGSSP
ncbi:MAG: chemotaxis protein CheW [Methanospirillum sp.]|nr:chemotaxis protein CheW [Methanospirillum sp.]